MKTTQWAVWVLAAAMAAGVQGVRAQEEVVAECGTPETLESRVAAAVCEAEQEADRAAEAVREEKAKCGTQGPCAKKGPCGQKGPGRKPEACGKKGPCAKKGLVLHYSFAKGGPWEPGSVVKDLSGAGHDGRIEGDGLEAVPGIGKRAKAARFDGKGDYIRVPRDEALEPQELTIAAWVKMREGDTWENASTIAFKRNSSFHHNEGYDLELFSDRTARSTIAGPSAAQSRIQSTAPMADGIWHHVAMTHSPGDTRLYIDGTLAGSGAFPREVVHNAEADLLIAGRDHAAYPMGNFGMYDLAEVMIWDRALDAKALAALHAARAGRPGVAEAGADWKALVEFGADRRLDSHGIVPERKVICGESLQSLPVKTPPRVFPPWTPAEKKTVRTGLAAELKTLVEQGKRDRAASPEFLKALDALLEKYPGGGAEEKPSDQLPLKPEFRGPGMPAGWSAVNPAVWQFGDGEARQVESRANTRYVLFYEPGMEWTDYEVTLRFESDAWFAPPANSGAELYVRYKSTKDSYRLDWNGNGNLSVISCEATGERIIVRTALGAEVMRDGKPWTVRMQGGRMLVEHEGKRCLELNDSLHLSGTVGLESIHIPMKFSGFEVK